MEKKQRPLSLEDLDGTPVLVEVVRVLGPMVETSTLPEFKVCAECDSAVRWSRSYDLPDTLDELNKLAMEAQNVR